MEVIGTVGANQYGDYGQAITTDVEQTNFNFEGTRNGERFKVAQFNPESKFVIPFDQRFAEIIERYTINLWAYGIGGLMNTNELGTATFDFGFALKWGLTDGSDGNLVYVKIGDGLRYFVDAIIAPTPAGWRANSWHMYTLVATRDDVEIWVDNVNILTFSLVDIILDLESQGLRIEGPKLIGGSSAIKFGKSDGIGGVEFPPFVGQLDDITIWSAALGAEEIDFLYSSPIKPCVNPCSFCCQEKDDEIESLKSTIAVLSGVAVTKSRKFSVNNLATNKGELIGSLAALEAKDGNAMELIPGANGVHATLFWFKVGNFLESRVIKRVDLLIRIKAPAVGNHIWRILIRDQVTKEYVPIYRNNDNEDEHSVVLRGIDFDGIERYQNKNGNVLLLIKSFKNDAPLSLTLDRMTMEVHYYTVVEE
eukprot:TRINITY_DN21808_c0_g1_i1.p1 TRINITY_DN21808_c0_g1~~TRINITY_DN21808_c0_g1_i1.p1  ORF type:complete len:463 (-),score=64.91 TRINITY_DN21808_c0_g1_i1:54-1319(-)